MSELSVDWQVIEHALNEAATGASEPLYSQTQDALAALFRIVDALSTIAEGRYGDASIKARAALRESSA